MVMGLDLLTAYFWLGKGLLLTIAKLDLGRPTS